MKKYFYHVTDPENLSGILKHGLKASDGMIFIFDEKMAAASIAINQCGLLDYALLKIDPAGLTEELIADNVAESTAKYQFYTKQDLIQPKYISCVNCFTIKI